MIKATRKQKLRVRVSDKDDLKHEEGRRKGKRDGIRHEGVLYSAGQQSCAQKWDGLYNS